MANLFQKAVKKGKSKSAAKSDKEVIIIKDKQFHTNLTQMVNLNKKISALSAEAKTIDGELRERGLDEFTKLYDETGKFPGSIQIEARDKTKPAACYDFIPVDRYIKIDEERAGELEEQYGEEIITTDVKFSMDSKLVEKYGDTLSSLIEESDEIDDEDKDKLIAAVVSFTVKKGTIKELGDYTSKRITTEEVLEDIRPVYMLKNIKIVD